MKLKKIGNNMEIISLDDFLDDGILVEKTFRKKIEKVNWDKYLKKKVLIKGCASVPIPTWAYMILTAELTKYAKQIFFGELCSAFQIFKKN